jgi:hypothetical protein
MKKLILFISVLVSLAQVYGQTDTITKNESAPLYNIDTLDKINIKFFDLMYEMDKFLNLENLSTEKRFEFTEKAFAFKGYSYLASLELYVKNASENAEYIPGMSMARSILIVPFEKLDDAQIKATFPPNYAELMLKIKAFK